MWTPSKLKAERLLGKIVVIQNVKNLCETALSHICEIQHVHRHLHRQRTLMLLHSSLTFRKHFSLNRDAVDPGHWDMALSQEHRVWGGIKPWIGFQSIAGHHAHTHSYTQLHLGNGDFICGCVYHVPQMSLYECPLLWYSGLKWKSSESCEFTMCDVLAEVFRNSRGHESTFFHTIQLCDKLIQYIVISVIWGVAIK